MKFKDKIEKIFEDRNEFHKYNLEVHQIINYENLITLRKLIDSATFNEEYEKKLVLDYITKIENNAKLIEKVFHDAEANVQK